MTRKTRVRNPVTVGEAMKRLFHQLGVERIIDRHSIWSCWEDVVGTDVAAHTQPEFFSGSCLFITVDHSTWMHQLNFLKDQILANIRKRLGPTSVTEIRFRLGTLSRKPQCHKSNIQESIHLSKDEEDEIRSSLDTISSPEIQERLYRIMLKDRVAKKSQTAPPNP